MLVKFVQVKLKIHLVQKEKISKDQNQLEKKMVVKYQNLDFKDLDSEDRHLLKNQNQKNFKNQKKQVHEQCQKLT